MSVLNEVLEEPVMLILSGSMRQGKTATAMRIIERIHDEHPEREIFYYFPQPERIQNGVFPKWFNIVDSPSAVRLPRYSVLLADESAVWSNSKNFKKGKDAEDSAKELSQLLQREQTKIVINQSLAELDKQNFRYGAVLGLKYYYSFSSVFEREELRSLARRVSSALEYFAQRENCTVKEFLYLQGKSGFGEYYRVRLPSFYSDMISKIWSLVEWEVI